MSRENFFQKDRMKMVREEVLQMSQQKLAQELGVPLHKVKDIESGKSSISPAVALTMEDKFFLNFKWLLTGIGSMRGETASRMPTGSVNVNANVLEAIIREVEDGLAAMNLILEAKRKARLISLLYDYSIESGRTPDKETVDRYLGLIS